MDRFIPNRSAMDFGFAQYMLREGKMLQANTDNLSTYETHLREVFNIDPTRRLLVFGGKKRSAPAPTLDVTSRDTFSPCKVEGERHVNQLVDRILDAPDVIDDFYLNLLDWSNTNVLAIAIGMVVYLWDGSSGKISGIVEVDHEKGPVTSIRWASDGRHIAVGLDSSEVHLWDTSSNRQLRTLSDGHRGRVGSMDWNKHVLTTGSMDGRIIEHDVRVKDHIVWNCRGHQKEVCGLKWSASGRLLASGGSDNVVYIWDRSMASSKWLYKFKDHNASVKALDWCPFQENLLASGGGASDNSIKYWNTTTGACLNSVETGSQVCALLWSKHEPEILSSHGFISNNLVLWKYPSMVRMAELEGHSSRVLHMVQSPDGCTVASLSADETLRFWKVLESPRAAKPKENIEPFAYINRSRIR